MISDTIVDDDNLSVRCEPSYNGWASEPTQSAVRLDVHVGVTVEGAVDERSESGSMPMPATPSRSTRRDDGP